MHGDMELGSFRGSWFVVKVGGELVADRQHFARTVGAAVAALHGAGIRVALVHGGGPQATALGERLAVPNVKVAGVRVTQPEMLRVLALAHGEVSHDLAVALTMAGVPALCTSGVSAGLVVARRKPPVKVPGVAEPVDYGEVGEVHSVNTVLLNRLSDAGVVPVIGFLASGGDHGILNVNADTVAARMAGQLGAVKLFLVSNVPGVLRDKNDPRTRIPKLTPSAARGYIAEKVIVDGMIPKVEESLAMLQEGVGAVHILGLDPPTSILDEAREPGSRGTVFTAD